MISEKRLKNNVAGSLADTDPVPSEAVVNSLADAPAAPEIQPLDDPIRLFKAAVATGVSNTAAQVSNFNASIASFMGNEYAMQDSLNEAQRIQAAGAYYLADAETFEQFLDQPTFGGFINQAITATGQFVPSAVASIALAMTGAGVGAGVTAAVTRKAGTEALKKTIIPQSIAAEAGTKKEVRAVIDKFVAIEANKAKKTPSKLDPLTPDEQKMIDNLYAHIRNKRIGTGAKAGGLIGAGSQEQVMGQGIAFGDYAKQGMTDKDAVLASGLQGLGFTAIGLGSEVAVFKSVQNVVNARAPKGINTRQDAPVMSRRSRIAQVAGTTAVAEGLAEAGQEELSVQQKFRIDEDYTQQIANLDRANALFAGFFGGIGVGTAIGTPSAVSGKMYDLAKKANEQFNQGVFDEATGEVLPEKETDLRAQFEAMDNPGINKDMVWSVEANRKTMENLEAELNAKYPKVEAVDINRVGTLYTTNPEKAESFANVMSANPLNRQTLDQWLANNNGYSQARAPGDNYAVRVEDANGNVIWEQSTTKENLAKAEAAAEAVANKQPGFTVKSKELEEVIGERMQDEGLDPNEQEDSFLTAEQEIGNIYDVQEPAAVEEGRGSFLDPITPRQKGKQVWQIPSTDITYDQALVEEAKSLVPVEFEREFEENINKKRYSESLLKAFIDENVKDPTGAFYKINENTDRGGFNLIKYNMGYQSGVSQPTTADITKSVNLAKRRARGSRFTIETPEMDKPLGVDMPTLVNQGRVLAKRFKEPMLDGDLGSALSGLGFILGALEGNYAIYYDGKLLSDEALNDPGAFVYTKAKGKERYTLQDLQRASRNIPSDPDFVDRDLLLGQDFKENQEMLEAQIADQKRKIKEREKNPISDFTSNTGETVTQQSVLQKMDAKLARLEQQLEQARGEAQQETSEATTPNETLQDEYNRRLFKNPYAKGSFKQGGPKPGVYFSSVVEQHLDSTFLQDFKRIATTKLGLTKPYRIFSTTEDISAEALDGDVDLANRVQVALGKLGPDGSTRGMNIQGADFDVILVQTREGLNAAEQGARAFVVAHEIGHSFVNQELEKSLSIPKLREGLLDAYNAELQNNNTAQYTNDEQGFREWMSDQVGSYLLDETKKAQNQTDSFFKRLANKIRAFVKDFSSFANRRYNVAPAFVDYVTELKRINTDPGHFMVKYLTRAEIEQTVEKIGKEIPLNDPKAPQKIQQTVNRLKETGNIVGVGEFLKVVLFAKDNLLRGYGKPGKALAQMFRGQSQSQEEVGLLTATVTRARAKMNEIQAILGVTKSGDMTEDKMKILLDAENNDIPTEQLGPQAKQIREWLDRHYESEDLKAIGVDKLSNFFPRSIAIQEIAGDDGKKEALANLLMEYNPGLTKKEADLSVEITLSDATNEIELAVLKQAEELGTVKETLEALKKERNLPSHARYSLGLTKARVKLYSRIPTKRLRDIEVLEDPHRALQKYIDNTVKKVELNKRGGPKRIEELLNQIENPQQKEQATKTVLAMLGKVEPISNGMFKSANQIGLAFNVTTLLTFATFASFPDLAGPILRSKDFGALRTASKTIFNMIQDKEEAAQLAKDIGVVGIDAMMETFVGAGELDYTSEGTKKFTNKFFRLIGLEQFTRFTRIFAAGMGKAFLLDNAKKAAAGNQRSIRYLKELGLTAEEVNKWAGGNINEAGNEKIKLALARFVDESIVRPNAAERPTWASDPRFALVWQLKSFFYAYGKTIVGGSMNEMQSRYTEAGLKGAAVPLFLGAATLLPLTMLGFDLRERFKVGLAWVLPGVSPDDKNYRRSQDMDWGEYTTEIIDRSGVLGPFTLALPLFMSEKRYGDPMWVGPLGPTVEKGYDLFTGDLRLKDLTPLWNNL